MQSLSIVVQCFIMIFCFGVHLVTFDRLYRSAGQEVTNVESCTQGIEDLCWTQNETSKGHMPSSRNEDGIETADQLNFVHENHETSALPRSNLRAERSFSRSNPENWRKRYTDGKRKHGSTPEVSYLGTSCQPLKSRTTGTRNSRQRGGIILGPVIEVDELHSPEANSSDSSTARVRQIESDELLAQQLQEQLYNESLRTGDSEEVRTPLLIRYYCILFFVRALFWV